MGRIIFLALVGVVAWLGWRLWRASLARPQQNHVPDASNHEALVECRHCGVRLPKSTALVQRGNTSGQAQQEDYFCSAQHRDEHNGNRSA